MKVNQSAALLSGLPIILLGFALLIAFISDFSSVIGLILCIAAIISSLERTIYAYSKKKWPLFVFVVVVSLSVTLSSKTLIGSGLAIIA